MVREDVEDDEDLLAALEDEDDDEIMASLREKRMMDLKNELAALRERKENEFGQYEEKTSEKEVMTITAHEKACVVHFYHPDFRRCMIMDEHLRKMSQKHRYTRFLRVFVENVPWLVTRLELQVLPCLMVFIHGVIKDKLIGFEELVDQDGRPAGDSFQTSLLEYRLAKTGVLVTKPQNDIAQR